MPCSITTDIFHCILSLVVTICGLSGHTECCSDLGLCFYTVCPSIGCFPFSFWLVGLQLFLEVLCWFVLCLVPFPKYMCFSKVCILLLLFLASICWYCTIVCLLLLNFSWIASFTCRILHHVLVIFHILVVSCIIYLSYFTYFWFLYLPCSLPLFSHY